MLRPSKKHGEKRGRTCRSREERPTAAGPFPAAFMALALAEAPRHFNPWKKLFYNFSYTRSIVPTKFEYEKSKVICEKCTSQVDFSGLRNPINFCKNDLRGLYFYYQCNIRIDCRQSIGAYPIILSPPNSVIYGKTLSSQHSLCRRSFVLFNQIHY